MSEIELVRQVRDHLGLIAERVGVLTEDLEPCTPDYLLRNNLLYEMGQLNAALAEMERDQPFIEAAEAYCTGSDGRTWTPGSYDALMAAYRARREGMKHAE